MECVQTWSPKDALIAVVEEFEPHLCCGVRRKSTDRHGVSKNSGALSTLTHHFTFVQARLAGSFLQFRNSWQIGFPLDMLLSQSQESASVPLSDSSAVAVEIRAYHDESDLPEIITMIAADLSEPYSIYVYRYFIHQWPGLCFVV